MVNVDFFKKIERKRQEKRLEDKVFEADPDGRPKFFVTFAYPYMNGYLHIGHAFTFGRADVAARFRRMRGYNVLFPQGFHCTGGPIVGAARRIAEGDPKQIAIMKLMGIPEEEIPKFADPKHRLEVFPKAAKEHLIRYGASVDRRRTFITTEYNPHYDAFIRRQYLRLRDMGYVKQGPHPVVRCPKEKTTIQDHDRLVGEGVSPTEVRVIKFRDDEGIVYPIATYRPETIFGVTNLRVNPEATYVLAEVNGEKRIITKEAAMKLREQNFEVREIKEFKGSELEGKEVIAPLVNRRVKIYPADFVDPRVGTGVVMSVPAHAPFDYYYAQKLGIEPIVIIKVEGFGEVPAKDAIERTKGPKDVHERLKKATELLYKEEFNKGVMIVDPLKGVPVRIARERTVEMLGKDVLKIRDLPDIVICRCGARGIVKIVNDQRFLDYGDKERKERTLKYIDERLKTFPEEAKKAIRDAAERMEKRPFARQSGLGSRLPRDPNRIIEPLSDSTIYMALYTIYHYVKKYDPSQLKPELFDYVFLGKGSAEDVSEATGIPKEDIERMREEFLYRYPVDVRVTGKDLLMHHIVFAIYHHIAFFGEERTIRAVSANGRVLIKGKKMSKSKGNFITLKQVVEEMPVDAVRIALTTGGQGLDDVDFRPERVESIARRLLSFYETAKSLYGKGREGDLRIIDKRLVSVVSKNIEEATRHMERYEYRLAFSKAFYENVNALKRYLKRTKGDVHKDVVSRVIESVTKMISPFAPHIAEEIRHELGHDTYVSTERRPEPREIDEESLRREEFVERFAEQISKLLRLLRKKKRSVNKGTIFAVGKDYETLKDALDYYKERFGIEFEVVRAEESDHEFARKASEGRPMIRFE